MLLSKGRYTYINLLNSGIRELRWKKDDTLILHSMNDHIIIYLSNEIEKLSEINNANILEIEIEIKFITECLRILNIQGIYIKDKSNALDTVCEFEKKNPIEFKEKLRNIGYTDLLFKFVLLVSSIEKKEKIQLNKIKKLIPDTIINNINKRYALVEDIYK